MRNDKIRRFRPRSNKFRSRRPNNGINSNGIIDHIHGQKNNISRNSSSRNPHNLERIIEKYKNLAKEALSTGDKILYENYLQHSDHFSRILSEVNESRSKNNISTPNQNDKTNFEQQDNISKIEEKK